MIDIKFEFPRLITVENLSPQGATNLSVNKNLVDQIQQFTYNGVVTKEGIWGVDKTGQVLCPDQVNWKVQWLSAGRYKVTHNLGQDNTSLSLTLFQQPGSIMVVEHSPTSFTVQTTLGKAPTDMPWAFTLIKAISPPR